MISRKHSTAFVVLGLLTWAMIGDKKIPWEGLGVFFAAASALAATRQAYISSQTAQTELRAYLMAERCKLERKSNNVLELLFEFKNFGSTPAHQVKGYFQVSYCVDTFEGEAWIKTEDPKIKILHYGVVAPGSGREQEISTDALSPECLHELEVGTQRVFISGRFEYIDVFGNERFSRFQFRSKKNIILGKVISLSIDQVGNIAN